jgi:copper chaperone CopZ
MHVRENLSKVATVKEVSIGSATVEFDDTTITTADLARAVESAGYTVVKSE